jgi:hypothetical protein
MTSKRRPDLTNHHPAVVEDLTKHAEQTQLRIADAITKYAGSMLFVYVHIALFAFWMLVLERSPWPTLTLTVSLEAIFLSTFVMIGQNRQATFQQQKADHDFLVEEHELDTNTERSSHRATYPRDPPSRGRQPGNRNRVSRRRPCDGTTRRGAPMGKAMAHMAVVFAELERDFIRSRTREALAVRRDHGVVLGRSRGPVPRISCWSRSRVTCRDPPHSTGLAGRLVAFGPMIGGIALLGTVTATLASWLVEIVAAEKEQAEDLQVTVRRLENKIDRLAAQSTRGRTADRS